MFRRELKRPPRIAPITDSAWKSSIRRETPTWPMRISVWTAPGRWTTWTNRSRTAPASAIPPLVAAPDAATPPPPSPGPADPAPRGPPARRPPAAEQPLDDRPQVDPLQVATDDDGRSG